MEASQSGACAFQLRHLQRFPLGLPYPETVAAVRAVLLHPALGGEIRLVVDGTGVGRPVVDLLRSAGWAPVPVTITGGIEERKAGEWFRVPKVRLVLGLQALVDSGRLRVAAGLPLASPFLEELRAFRVKINPRTRRASFGGKGAHDDLVLAVALSAWLVKKSKPSFFNE
jgi:hypothetical protein